MDRILVIHYWAAGSETLDDNSIEYRYKIGENWDVYAVFFTYYDVNVWYIRSHYNMGIMLGDYPTTSPFCFAKDSLEEHFGYFLFASTGLLHQRNLPDAAPWSKGDG